jgi:protein TonB
MTLPIKPLIAVAAVAAGALVASAVFSVLFNLISSGDDVAEVVEATRIEFSRMRRDTPVATKRDEKVQRERPPPTPEVPMMSLAARSSIDSNIVRLAPSLDVRNVASPRLGMAAGSDRDVLPLVRIAPEYPPRAVSRGIEGWVQVQFTITATGTVKDARVVAAEPPGIFDEAALKSILRWRYNPRVDGGVAVERVGVQTIIRFQLEK